MRHIEEIGSQKRLATAQAHDVQRPELPKDALDFVDRIFALSDAREARDFSLASEACLSASEIVAQIERRLRAFAPDLELDAFLRVEFAPAFERALKAGKPALIEIQLDPEAITPRLGLSEIRANALQSKPIGAK